MPLPALFPTVCPCVGPENSPQKKQGDPKTLSPVSLSPLCWGPMGETVSPSSKETYMKSRIGAQWGSRKDSEGQRSM